MKRIFTFFLTLILSVSFFLPSHAESWGDLFNALGGLLTLAESLDSKDERFPSLEQVFDGPTSAVMINGKERNVHKSFIAAMDAYEAFFDEYIAFMKDGDFSLTKYTQFLTKYTEAMTALEGIDERKLSADDTAYYLHVMLRIDVKLLQSLEE